MKINFLSDKIRNYIGKDLMGYIFGLTLSDECNIYLILLSPKVGEYWRLNYIFAA